MSLLEAIQPEVTSADDARRIRMVLSQMMMQRGLQQVAQITKSRGRKEIDAALGADAAQLPVLYSQLQKALLQIDPARKTPDLPS
jgi:hypothetical protein